MLLAATYDKSEVQDPVRLYDTKRYLNFNVRQNTYDQPNVSHVAKKVKKKTKTQKLMSSKLGSRPVPWKAVQREQAD